MDITLEISELGEDEHTIHRLTQKIAQAIEQETALSAQSVSTQAVDVKGSILEVGQLVLSGDATVIIASLQVLLGIMQAYFAIRPKMQVQISLPNGSKLDVSGEGNRGIAGANDAIQQLEKLLAQQG